MAESNDNWECIGKVDLINKEYPRTVDLYVKYVNGIPFYKIFGKVVYKSNGKHNAYIDLFSDKYELVVPSWDRIQD